MLVDHGAISKTLAASAIPLKRMGEPRYVIVAFLASDVGNLLPDERREHHDARIWVPVIPI